MTTYNKTTLKTFFETGDVPTGQNFSDFIDSYVNIVETGIQNMAGALSSTELIAARVSAGNGNFTGNVTIAGTLSAGIIAFDGLAVSSLTVNTATVSGTVSANSIFSNSYRMNTGIVSAAGTAQATGAQLSFTINIGAGVVDGQNTGFSLPSNTPGRVQYITNGGASANLWPPTGGQINALSSNAAFGMTSNTLYTIIHTLSSGYAVK